MWEDKLAEIAAVVASGALGGIAIFVKDVVKAYKAKKEKEAEESAYNEYNKKLERVLKNAVCYAEEVFKLEQEKDNTVTKEKIALAYISSLSEDIYEKEGESKLKFMIKRKVYQSLRIVSPKK